MVGPMSGRVLMVSHIKVPTSVCALALFSKKMASCFSGTSLPSLQVGKLHRPCPVRSSLSRNLVKMYCCWWRNKTSPRFSYVIPRKFNFVTRMYLSSHTLSGSTRPAGMMPETLHSHNSWNKSKILTMMCVGPAIMTSST